MSSVNPTEVAKLEAAKRSLAISQRAVSTALDAARKGGRKRRTKKSATAGSTKVHRKRRTHKK